MSGVGAGRLAALVSGSRPRAVLILMMIAMAPIAPYGHAGMVPVLALSLFALDRPALAAAGRLARHPAALAFWAMAGWALISSIWAPDPGRAAELSIRLAVLGALAVCLVAVVRTVPREALPALGKVLGGAVVAMVLLFTLEGLAGGLVARLLRAPGEFGLHGHVGGGMAIPAIYVWAAVAVAATDLRRPAMAAILVAATAVPALLLDANAALVALPLAAAVWVAVRFGGRRTVQALLALAMAAALFAPGLVRVVTEQGQALIAEAPASWRHRAIIWEFVADKIDEAPVLGAGFDASRAIGRAEGREFSAGTDRMRLLPLHPHNGPLQIRLELGLPGVLLWIAMVTAVAREIWLRMPARPRWASAAAAGFSAWLFVFSVGFGAWQNWWLATAMLGLAWFALAERRESESNVTADGRASGREGARHERDIRSDPA